jgi:hypothetical protein
MELKQHKNLELTLGIYTYTFPGDPVKVLDALPGIPTINPVEAETLAAPGTDKPRASTCSCTRRNLRNAL